MLPVGMLATLSYSVMQVRSCPISTHLSPRIFDSLRKEQIPGDVTALLVCHRSFLSFFLSLIFSTIYVTDLKLQKGYQASEKFQRRPEAVYGCNDTSRRLQARCKYEPHLGWAELSCTYLVGLLQFTNNGKRASRLVDRAFRMSTADALAEGGENEPHLLTAIEYHICCAA